MADPAMDTRTALGVSGTMSMTAEQSHGFRLTACATPIALEGVDGFQTIPAVTPVSFLSPPATIGTVHVDTPRGAIRAGQYFTARFLSNSGWRRASFLALAADEAPGMRDVVTIRMLAEPQEATQRAHARERIGLTVTGRVKRASALAGDAALSVEVVDASQGGVCVETPASLAVGDVLYLEGPKQPDAGADFEVLRSDPALRNRYGGRFLEESSGKALFEQLVQAAQEQRANRRARPGSDEHADDVAAEPQHRGMHHRTDD
jgi:hypothetical protein